MANIHFHYFTPETPAGPRVDYDIGDAVQWGSIAGLTTYARLGESAISSILVDDPAKGSNYVGLKRIYVIEADCDPDNSTIYEGYIGEQAISRGEGEETFPFGRRWELQLSDDNAVLSFRVISGSDGNRPAETAAARVSWLLATNYIGDVQNNGLVNLTGLASTNLDPNDYRGQYGRDVLTDVALQTGYNFWAQLDESTSPHSIQLFFDDPEGSAFTSLCKISNVLSDVSAASNVFAPSKDTKYYRDPSRIAAGVFLPYDGGSLYHYSYPTAYSYGFRDQIAPTASVKTSARASNLATRFLSTFDEQDERVETTILVPPAQVNDIKAGHRIQVKLDHAPDFGSFRWCRVTERTIANWNTVEDLYEMRLILVPGTPNYMGAVMGAYLYGKNYDGGGYWQNTGDDEPVGWAEVPLVGPVSYDQAAGDPRYSITINQKMIATIDAALDWGGLLSGTVYLRVKVNGVTVGEDSNTGGGGYTNFRLSVSLPDYQLNEGDVVSGIGEPAGGWGNTGINGTYLKVHRDAE